MTDLDLDAIRGRHRQDAHVPGDPYFCFGCEASGFSDDGCEVLALCDEVERLRNENIALRHQRDTVTDYLDSIMPTRDYENLMQRDIPHNPHR